MGGEDGGGGPDAQWDAEEEEEESSAEGPQEMDEDVRRRSGIILELASAPPAPVRCLCRCARLMQPTSGQARRMW